MPRCRCRWMSTTSTLLAQRFGAGRSETRTEEVEFLMQRGGWPNWLFVYTTRLGDDTQKERQCGSSRVFGQCCGLDNRDELAGRLCSLHQPLGERGSSISKRLASTKTIAGVCYVGERALCFSPSALPKIVSVVKPWSALHRRAGVDTSGCAISCLHFPFRPDETLTSSGRECSANDGPRYGEPRGVTS